MIRNFEGVLAVFDRPSIDGTTYLKSGEPRDGDTTPAAPLYVWKGSSLSGEDAVGTIDHLWFEGDLLRYSGEIDDGKLTAYEIAGLEAGKFVGLVTLQHRVENTPGMVEGWGVTGATLGQVAEKRWPEVTLALSAAQAKPWESMIAEIPPPAAASNDGPAPDDAELGAEADPALRAKFDQGSRDGQRDRRDG